MKRTLSIMVMLAALLALVPAGMASAQSPAYNTPFTTSITYQNVGSSTATISLEFYDEASGTAIPISRPSLAPNAGTSIFVGSLNDVPAGFRGSAVLSSSQPVVATLVQVPQSSTVKNRPLSNGFTGSEGANTFLVATALKTRFNTTSIFSVQNVHTSNVNLTVRFYNADNPSATPVTVTHNNLPPGSAKYFDLGQLSQIPNNFNGSVEIDATGPVVASAMELSTNGTAAAAFEGVASGSNTVYMPSALCNAFGGQNSAYAVQNTGNSAANVTVEYSNGKTANATIQPGAKASFQGCNANPGGNPAGFSGSATITSNQPIVAIGKVFGAGLSTAFVGAPSGANELALPYVRWSESRFNTGARDRQRAFIAIQNVGGSTVNGATVKYVDKNGNVVGTHNLPAIAPGAKVNSNPSNIGAAGNEFGYYADGTFGGSAIIEGSGSSQLVAVVRIASFPASGFVGEDYNGIPVQ